MNTDQIAWAAQMACLLELCAEKPGNVSRTWDFADTHFVDFMSSAIAIGPALRDAVGAPAGETILRAVRDTRRFVNTNTNLGMILLLAPLAKAAGRERSHPDGLRAEVGQVLRALTVEDARLAFEAIRLAAPGGLGEVERYDVRQPTVDVTLREAMAAAQHRDSVAREYVTDFEITFELGCAALRQFWAEGRGLADAIVQTALVIIAQTPDTLIARKEGVAAAQAVSRQAEQVLQAGGAFSERGREALRRFDRAVRDSGHRLNPGATADLVAASLFVFLIDPPADRASALHDVSFSTLLTRW
jgi:triphosphoribosyl-dephospho-CoA synthase